MKEQMMNYHTYSYGSMKPKADKFRSTYVSTPGSSTYKNWKDYLEGPSANDWNTFSERFAEDFQFALLVGVTIRGMACSDWRDICRTLCNESAPFQSFSKLCFQGQVKADWQYFAAKLALETSKGIYYPTLYPEWLVPNGYTQRQYLQDLAVYWDNIHDEYYKPWPTTRIGQDSPELARLRKLGQEARREIDAVAKYGAERSKS
jgi:hypothetical protein